MMFEKGGRKCKFVLLMSEIDQPRQHHIGEADYYDKPVQTPVSSLLVPSSL